MNPSEFEKHNDEKKIYCRKLGHDITFGYCRKEGITEPCYRIVRCWIEHIDIEGYLTDKFGDTFLDKFAGRESKDKITSIVEILEKAKKHKEVR